MQKKVIIELWSDYTCPYCYIGKKRLELAIENLGLSNEISVELKSYQLDSNSIDTKDMNILEHFKEKYKLTDDEDRKSTRLNSSHVAISYAVFCLKKKNAS